MLTADLVRTSVARGVVKPRYVDRDDARIQTEAATLLRTFTDGVGRTRGELEEAIADHIGDSPQYMVTRGLARLLWKRCNVETVADADPVVVRQKVFASAAARWPVGRGAGMSERGAIIAAIADELGISAEAVDQALFADLERQQVMVEMSPCSVEELVDRYNLALAQGVLLKATEVRVFLPADADAKRVRQLLRMLKFHRLMHDASRTEDGIRIAVDGPLSLFNHTTRYGLQLALFLPTLCHCPQWSVEADVVWGRDAKKLVFRADQDTGLVTHTRDLGTWEADEERHFRAAFKKLKSPWKLRRGGRIVDLGGHGVLVPDYELAHDDGRRAILDIVWFWRRRQFLDRLSVLAEHGPPNLIVALATRYNADRRGQPPLPAELPGAVYRFKGVIQVKKLIACAEEVASA